MIESFIKIVKWSLGYDNLRYFNDYVSMFQKYYKLNCVKSI